MPINMKLFPRSIGGRIICILWLFLCADILFWAFSERNSHLTDVGFAWNMLMLTFPSGYVLGMIAAVIIHMLYSTWGIVTPGGFLPNAISWIIFVPAGYFQWFVLIPWLYRKRKRDWA